MGIKMVRKYMKTYSKESKVQNSVDLFSKIARELVSHNKLQSTIRNPPKTTYTTKAVELLTNMGEKMQ